MLFAADERHNIPIECFDKASNNYRDIYDRLADLLLRNNFSPAYVVASEYAEVVSQFEWIRKKAGAPYTGGFDQVFVLEDLFLELWQMVLHVLHVLTVHADPNKYNITANNEICTSRGLPTAAC